MKGQTIKRVLCVVDTRDLVEEGDRFIRVSGTGNSHDCARCGREHEVHVYVELSDGSQAIIGSSCANEPEMAAKIRSLMNAEARLAGLRRKAARFEAELATWNSAYSQISALPLPPITSEEAPCSGSGGRLALRMGDATVYSFEGRTEERLQRLTESWRSRRMVERGLSGFRPHDPGHSIEIARLEERLARSRA